MGKKSLYILSIIAVILLVFFLDFKSKNVGVEKLNAYDAASGGNFGPGLVNAFEGGITNGTPPTPPYGPLNDIWAWIGKAPATVPTPTWLNISGTFPMDYALPLFPAGCGINLMRITWTGKDLYSGQFIELPASKFENVGCTNPSYNPDEAKDWSCYDYIRFYFFCNGVANGGATTEEILQSVSLYDGSVTITVGAVNVPIKNPYYENNFDEHFSLSLKYLANMYITSTAKYFDVTNIQSFMINAVNTNYNDFGNTPLPSEGFPSGSRSVIMYYEKLTLGAANLTNPPPPVATPIATIGLPGSVGVTLSWSISPAGTGKSPVSAYHIYRATAAAGPYISVGYQSATTSAYTDSALPYGNAEFCYKILTCDNGPTASIYDEKHNTINATYNEALLADANSQCIFVPQFPTHTPTRTPMVSPTVTPTFDPNLTPTPVVGDDIKEAHVYPNPFNPNAGTGKFKVDNVPVDTKVQIFSMDGSLVMEGVTSGTAGFAWDGRNKNGSKVVSGLYYLVLKDKKGKSDVKRIIVCYKCDPIDNE